MEEEVFVIIIILTPLRIIYQEKSIKNNIIMYFYYKTLPINHLNIYDYSNKIVKIKEFIKLFLAFIIFDRLI